MEKNANFEKGTAISGFENYLIENERSQNTIDNYLQSIRDYFGRYKVLTKQNLIQYKQELFKEGKKPKTIHNRCVGLNQFCRYLGKQELCVKTVKIHQSSSIENVISVDEFNKLLEGLREDGDEKGYWMVKFLGKTGARVSEFTKLTKESLLKGYCEMWTKGKIRRIYIPESLIKESEKYFQKVEGDILFPSRYGKEMTSRGVASRLKAMSEKYEIREEVMHPHSFRHLYAVEFLKKNPNIALLADLMGHSSVATTSIYLKLSKEEQMRQFNEASDW